MEPDNNMNNTPEPATQTPPITPQPAAMSGGAQKEESAMGPMIGVVVIVLLLVAGGFYYYTQEQGGTTEEESTLTPEEQAAADQAEIDAVAEQSTSSAFSAIEADFNATDASSLDNTLNSIDSELSQ